MSREIKFRAWDERLKKMVISLPAIEATTYITIRSDENVKVMLFTGLLDKNGTEIFEGDIVKTENGIGSIEYELDSAQFWYTDTEGWPKGLLDKDVSDDRITTRLSEVIGNIYENKDLIK